LRPGFEMSYWSGGRKGSGKFKRIQQADETNRQHERKRRRRSEPGKELGIEKMRRDADDHVFGLPVKVAALPAFDAIATASR
jgi:hypothetical protein